MPPNPESASDFNRWSTLVLHGRLFNERQIRREGTSTSACESCRFWQLPNNNQADNTGYLPEMQNGGIGGVLHSAQHLPRTSSTKSAFSPPKFLPDSRNCGAVSSICRPPLRLYNRGGMSEGSNQRLKTGEYARTAFGRWLTWERRI
jgi:hypothetical protein